MRAATAMLANAAEVREGLLYELSLTVDGVELASLRFSVRLAG